MMKRFETLFSGLDVSYSRITIKYLVKCISHSAPAAPTGADASAGEYIGDLSWDQADLSL